MSKLERDIRFLKIYCVVTSLILAVLGLTGFVSNTKIKFEEIDVERINIIERNGDIKMVISNKERQHPGIVDGVTFDRERPPGLLFFNEIGEETGGLIYGGDSRTPGHASSLTFDKLRNDQTLGIRHLEDGDGNYQSALEMWQQPKIGLKKVLEVRKYLKGIEDKEEQKSEIEKALDQGLLPTTRLFLGKRTDNTVELVLSDSRSRPRIKLSIDKNDNPSLIFLDDSGNVAREIK